MIEENVFTNDKVMSEEEAQSIIVRLNGTPSAVTLGFSLIFNHLMNFSDSEKHAIEGAEAVRKDLETKIRDYYSGKLFNDPGVRKLTSKVQ